MEARIKINERSGEGDREQRRSGGLPERSEYYLSAMESVSGKGRDEMPRYFPLRRKNAGTASHSDSSSAGFPALTPAPCCFFCSPSLLRGKRRFEPLLELNPVAITVIFT